MKIVQTIPQPETDSKREIVAKNTERKPRPSQDVLEREGGGGGTDGLAFLARALRSAPIEMRTDNN